MCFTDVVAYFYFNFIFSLMSWFGGLLPVTPNWVVNTVPGFCRSQGVTNSVEFVQVKHFLFYLKGVRLYKKLYFVKYCYLMGIQRNVFLAFYIFLPLVEP